jgi:hypothetical protein
MAHRSWALLSAFLLLGCAQFELTGPWSDVNTEAEAIAIARAAVSANDDWVDRANFAAKRDDLGWVVTVWREPRAPGDYRFVFVSPKGKVTGYVRGL